MGGWKAGNAEGGHKGEPDAPAAKWGRNDRAARPPAGLCPPPSQLCQRGTHLLLQWSAEPAEAAMKTLGGIERKNMRLERGMPVAASIPVMRSLRESKPVGWSYGPAW